ncbi:MAG: hypothetical protein H6739_26935 [Alphaproteobacteria bacterium]|nr:hypothetical protein [Alphaproteobacteria bacterium]
MSPRLLPLALMLAGCNGSLLTIDVPFESTTTVEQGSIIENLAGGLGFGDFLNMDITDSQELRNQGVSPGDIQDVRLTEFELEAVAPQGADLSFLDALDIYVEAPGLDEVRVATAPGFPEGEALVVMTIEEVDLTEYAVSESMTITTDVSGHRPDVDTDVKARILLEVGVTAQGARNQANAR